VSNKEILEQAIQKAIENYAITETGEVRNRKTNNRLKGSINHKGYRYISVYLANTGKSKNINVHKLVALTYIPNSDNLPQINHIDGNRLNNNVDNLEWCTASYNVSDGFKRGRVIWNKGNISKERVMFYANKYPRQLFWLLTKDEFMVAKALWGEAIPLYSQELKERGFSRGGSGQVTTIGWQYHLQSMVIAPDPIKYLGENI